jgi:hypothetical protein
MGEILIIAAAVLAVLSVAFGVIAAKRTPRTWTIDRNGQKSAYASEADWLAAMTPDERAKLLDALIQKAADRETKWRDRHIMRRWGR